MIVFLIPAVNRLLFLSASSFPTDHAPKRELPSAKYSAKALQQRCIRPLQRAVTARHGGSLLALKTLRGPGVATTRAMNRSGLKYLVVLSAAAHFPGISNRIASFVMRNHTRVACHQEIVQGNGLDWTIARPPRLTQEQYATYRGRDGAAAAMAFTLSRKAVAAFMLDAIEHKKHFRKIVGIVK
jgi:hypothetical protein